MIIDTTDQPADVPLRAAVDALDVGVEHLIKLVDDDPDGILPTDEAEHQLRRFFHLKHRTDGSWAGDFRLTPDVGQKLAALLGPLTKPQTTRFETGASQDPGDTTTQDASTDHVVPDEGPGGSASTMRSPPCSTPHSAPRTSPPPVAPRPPCS